MGTKGGQGGSAAKLEDEEYRGAIRDVTVGEASVVLEQLPLTIPCSSDGYPFSDSTWCSMDMIESLLLYISRVVGEFFQGCISPLEESAPMHAGCRVSGTFCPIEGDAIFCSSSAHSRVLRGQIGEAG